MERLVAKAFIHPDCFTEDRRGRGASRVPAYIWLLHCTSVACSAMIYEGHSSGTESNFLLADIVTNKEVPKLVGKHSHVITSPPYINAQDYFRNFKLEFYLLEGVLPFRVDDLKNRFIGTERGNLLAGITEEELQKHRERVPQLNLLAKKTPRAEAVIHRYLHDLGNAFETVKGCLESGGTFVLVCGDNLIAGQRIRTWQILTEMLVERGFRLFDQFSDPIGDRMLAPKRCGHKGLIKEEVVTAFRLESHLHAHP